MRMHNNYMIVISTLFAVVFAIMIYSMIKHHRTCRHSAAKFTGTTGTVQWFWALVPLVILAFINFSLIVIPEDRSATLPKKIELAVVQILPDKTPMTGAAHVVEKTGDARQQ